MSNFFRKHGDKLAEDACHRGNLHVSDAYTGRRRLDNAADIDIDRIEADPQHREHFDEASLKSLARSLKEHGQKQPIRVRWDEGRNKYIIISGERRWRAAQLAAISSIQCVISEGNLTESEILRDQLIENALREDLKPTEQAKAFRDLMQQENFNAKQLAAYLHIAPSTVSRRLAVLDLPDDLQQTVDEGEISIKDAIRISKQKCEPGANQQQRPRKKKKTREQKIVVDGFTVTVKARRILTDDLVLEGLARATEYLTASQQKAA